MALVVWLGLAPGARAAELEDDASAAGEAFAPAGPPPTASVLFRRIQEEAAARARPAPVPADQWATEANGASERVFVGSSRTFDGIRRAIADAQCEVDFQTYVWEPGSQEARKVLDALTRLQERRRRAGGSPVVVRLLVDSSAVQLAKGTIAKLVQSLEPLQLDPAVVQVEVSFYPHAGVGILHSKSVILDGRAAIVLTGNVQSYDSLNIAFELRGDVAAGLRSEFNDAWGRSRAASASRWSNLLSRKAAPAPGVLSCPSPPGPSVARIPMLIATRGADGGLLARRSDNTQDQTFLAAFANARRLIRVMTPNFNDDRALAALVDALGRGVTAQVLLSKGFNDWRERLPGQGGANDGVVRRLYERLGRAPRILRRLDIRWYSTDGASPVDGHDGNSHVKYASFDEQVAIIGNGNMDTQSWDHSREVNVVVDDGPLTREWDRQVFLANFDRAVPADQ